MGKIKRLGRWFGQGQKGFTLIELLVVVAILGVLAMIAVPSVGRFINKGKEEARNTDLHNVQTGVIAMMAESKAGVLNNNYIFQKNLNLVTADNGTNPILHLDDFMVGLTPSGFVKLPDVSYNITSAGVVSQNWPDP